MRDGGIIQRCLLISMDVYIYQRHASLVFLTLFTIDVIATINSWNYLNSKLTLLHNYLIERSNENLDDLATRLKNSDIIKRTKDK